MTDNFSKQITDHLENLNIDLAIQSALNTVKTEPTNSDARRLLIDLLIIAGDYERADKQAAILSTTDNDLTLGMELLRGRIRAAKAREEWFTNGAVPAFPEGPTSRDKLAMELAINLRENKTEAVKNSLDALTKVSETHLVKVNNKDEVSFRDADDRIPHALEILCSDGSYMWVDMELIDNIEFKENNSLRDLVWKPTTLRLRDGSETDVITCTTYFNVEMTLSQRLAKETDWQENTGGVVTGLGQKIFLAGDEAVNALDLKELVKSEAN